ncbi:MAG: hypothetical protein HOM38_09090 [Euryarchaeota archaeon]|jgi:hypothetical protein|nr:hypothetical protein [Euryarchaeota archaeon]
MSNTITVVLPNGREIPNVPAGTSSAVVQDIAIRNGLATLEDFQPKPKTGLVPDAVPKEDSPWYEDVGGFFAQNMDIPLGMAGAAVGVKMGAPLGPVGMTAGGLLGGAAGTFGGSLISDELTEEELNYNKAVEDALWSIGFDVATLGLGRPVKGAWIAAKKALGFSPEEVAKELVSTAPKVAEAGSIESLRQTQKLLEKQGASLTRYQTGNASALEVLAENLGEVGLVSGREFADNIQKVNEAGQKTLDDIFNVSLRTGASPAELGEGVFDIINAGKQAMQQVYVEGLDGIKSQIPNKRVNTAGISKRLNSFLESKNVRTYQKGESAVTSLLDKDTIKFVEEQLSGVLDLQNMTARSLIDVDKAITQQLRKFGDVNNKLYNATADAELAEVQHILKEAFINTLKQADKGAALEYKALKESYKQGSASLLPVINKNTIENAGRSNYDALGKMLTTQQNTSKIAAMYKSIDEAYNQLSKVKGLPSDIPYQTAKEAKQAIRQSFIKNLIPKAGTADFKIKDYEGLASQFSTPAGTKRLQTVMGEDAGRVKQLFNLFAEASKRPESTAGTLFLRGKEFAAVGTLLGAGGMAVAGAPGAIGTAAAILAAPVFLARLASNPKAVNKLLAMSKTEFKTQQLKEKALTFVISDVMDALSEEEQASLRNELRAFVEGE